VFSYKQAKPFSLIFALTGYQKSLESTGACRERMDLILKTLKKYSFGDLIPISSISLLLTLMILLFYAPGYDGGQVV
jgi:hypothetical protein